MSRQPHVEAALSHWCVTSPSTGIYQIIYFTLQLLKSKEHFFTLCSVGPQREGVSQNVRYAALTSPSPPVILSAAYISQKAISNIFNHSWHHTDFPNALNCLFTDSSFQNYFHLSNNFKV